MQVDVAASNTALVWSGDHTEGRGGAMMNGDPMSETRERWNGGTGCPGLAMRMGALALAAIVVLTASACSPGEDGRQPQQSSAALKTSSTTASLCPGGGQPTLQATAIGLVASSGNRRSERRADARCLVQPISFRVPAMLEITASIVNRVEAELEFRDDRDGRIHRCQYNWKRPKTGAAGRLSLVGCTGARASAEHTGRFFRLAVVDVEPGRGIVEVRARLGAPGPTPLLVTPSAARLTGAALAIPAAAVSEFEHIALDPLPGADPGEPLNLGPRSATVVGPGVVIRTRERGELATLPQPPQGGRYLLTLPYDSTRLQALGKTEDDLVVYEVATILPWNVPRVLAIRTDLQVDRTLHTVTLAVERATGFLSAVSGGARQIPYNGGPVMKGQVPVHLIYYGTLSGTQRAILEDLIANLGGSPWLQILSTYSAPSAGLPTTNIRLGQTWTVPTFSNTFPTPEADAVEKLVKRTLDTGRLPTDGNAIYLVVLGNDVASDCSTSCGWHTGGRILDPVFGPVIKYGLIRNPNVNGTGACACYPQVVASPNGDLEADAMTNAIAHEVAETLSDPEREPGWAIEVGSELVENADNCASQFGDSYLVGSPPKQSNANMRLGTRDFYIQRNWVNIGSGYGYCALRVETDAARFKGLSTTLPAPPAGAGYRPIIYGKQYEAFVGYTNSGDTTWRDEGTLGEQYALGSQSPQDNDFFGAGGRVPVTARVAPGGEFFIFAFPFSAAALVPGVGYTFQWRMVREAVRWFGDATPPLEVRAMSNSSEVTARRIPEVHTGGSLAITATFRNTSGAAWRAEDGYYLQVEGADFRGADRLGLDGESVEPGASHTFTAALDAPAVPGRYPIRWRMAQTGVGPFGPALEDFVNVAPVDGAEFVSQSIPAVMFLDESEYEVRATFRNTGNGPWNDDFGLDVEGPFIVRGSSSTVGSVPPGAMHELAVRVVPTNPGGPGAALPALAPIRLSFMHQNGPTLASGPQTSVEIRQGSNVTLAECAAQDIPPRMVAGQRYQVFNLMKNIGGTTWTTDYHLGSTPPGDSTWGLTSVPMGRSVPPGDSHRFDFEIVAPPPGSYTFGFMMYQSAASQSYFFAPCLRDVVVVSTDYDDAEVAVLEVGDMDVGVDHPIRVAMRNTGTSTWTASAGYRLYEYEPGESSPIGRLVGELGPDEAIRPGETREWVFTVKPLYAANGFLFGAIMQRGPASSFGSRATERFNVR
jgi:hypothetical protein